jgi:Flp pilus assembly protein TadD
MRAWREPDESLIRRDLGLAYFEAAATSHSASDLRQAYQILSQLAPSQRQDPEAAADLGSALLADGNARFAIQLFATAAAEEPSNARYEYCLGTALERAGKLDKAVERLKRSIALDPSQPDPYLELARLYKTAGRDALSQDALREYLRFMPQNIQLRVTD